MNLEHGYCGPFDIDLDCCSGLPDDVEQSLIDRWQAVSSRLLWSASGHRYGQCETTIRPCVRRCLGGTLPVPYKGSDGAWRNFSACGCSDDCSCTELCEVVLPGPIYAVEGMTSPIVEVGVDGEVVDPSAYRLDRRNNGWRLVGIGECWPHCQDMTAAVGESGSFWVTYMRGMVIDDLAIAANSELTCELVKACIPGCECRLPKNVSSRVRRGDAITFDTSKPWIKSLPLVGAFLDAVNPNGLSSESGVFSPDVAPIRITPSSTPVS